MKYAFLFVFSLAALFASADTYRTCSSTNGEFIKSVAGGTPLPCQSYAISDWNNNTDTVIVQDGFPLQVVAGSFGLECFMLIEQNANFEFDGQNDSIIIYNVMIVNGTFDIISNNTTIKIPKTGAKHVVGLLVVNSTGTVSNLKTANGDIAIEGNITGSGTIEFKGNATGGGTVNGDPFPWPASPWDLGSFGIRWDGTNWSNGTGPTNLFDRAIFGADYTSSNDPNIGIVWPCDGITIEEHPSKQTLGTRYVITFDNNENMSNLVSITNSGEFVVVDNVTASSLVIDAIADGLLTIKRNFNHAGKWSHIGFPVKKLSLATLGDAVTTGFTLNYGTPNDSYTNVFKWNASTSEWEKATAADKIGGNSFIIYTPTAGCSIAVSILEIFFNNRDMKMNYDYDVNLLGDDPGYGSSWTTSVKDGWNMWFNPLQAYIVSDELVLPADLENSIYVWHPNLEAYQTYVPAPGPLFGSGNAEYVSPHQAIFVKSKGNTGSFHFPTGNEVRTASPPTITSYFKTSQKIVLGLTSGSTDSVNTWITDNQKATSAFDSDFDAYYRTPGAKVPVFFSVSSDSLGCSVNCFKDLEAQEVYLSFYHVPTQGKTFNISLNKTKASGIDKVILEDIHLKTFTDLTQVNYTFVNDTSAATERFKIKVHKGNVGLDEDEDGRMLKFWFNQNQLKLEGLEAEEIKSIAVYNAVGQLLVRGRSLEEIQVETTGVVVVQLETTTGKQYALKMVK